MAENKDKRTVEIIVNGQQANASLKEMNAAAAVLYNQFSKLSADDPGRAKLLADYQALKGRIADVKTELTGVSQSAGVMKQAFANAFAIFTGGGLLEVAQKVWGFFMDSREEALASAKSSADLENTLKSTAHAAGLTAEEIRKIGTERAKVTLFDDDETNAASALLLTFTNIKKGVFEEAMPAIQDLATKMGGDGPADMKGASIQVGKALNDPIKGITALTRVGVSFTEQQKEQITQMVKSGNAAGAQKLILAELNKEFGGTAEAARKAAGGMATLSMWFGEFKETVGGKVNQVLDALSQWFGRVLDKAQPLVDMVMAIVDEFAGLYREIGDVLEGLGLFNDKTDTAALVIEVLKTALTVLLIPFRAAVTVAKAIVETFVDWYNKSEMLRGVLGGLGAVIVGLFTTIKDDAIKILGGVGDIIVGIFTLDKDKIAAGFKSALSATADLALESGKRAAEDFMKGYAANKDNHITRTVQVNTQETGGDEVLPAGAGKPDKVEESAADKKAREAKEKKAQAERDKADQARLNALKEYVKQEDALEDARISAIADKREREIADINRDARRKYSELTGLEHNYTEQVAAIYQERENRLKEVADKGQEEANKAKEKALQEAIGLIEAGETEKESLLALKHAQGISSEQQYQDDLYQLKIDALKKELALLEAAGKGETEQAKKIRAALNVVEKGHVEDKKALKDKEFLADQAFLKSAAGGIQQGIDLLSLDIDARKKHHGIYIALAGAKIVAEGFAEVQAIWATFSEMGPWGIALAAVQTGISVARTFSAINNLNDTNSTVAGYAAGGATGPGMAMSLSGREATAQVWQMLSSNGMMVGSNGKLMDNSGFAIAGIVHEDEYVVPKWMRADPQVAAVEQWLEARRLRGYFEGGATSGATLPAASAAPQSDGELTYAVLVQLLEQSRQQTAQLADVKDWQARLNVQLHAGEVEEVLAERKQVKLENGIRA